MISQGEYEQVVAKLDAVIKDLEEQAARVDSAAAAVLHALDSLDLAIGFVEAHKRMARLFVAVVKRVIRQQIDAVRALIHGIYAPLHMARSHHVWKEIKRQANEVSNHIDFPVNRVGKHWSGTAASRYFSAVAPQPRAATRIGATADKTWQALYKMAFAGFKFFLSLWIIMMIFNAAVMGAVAAFLAGRVDAAYFAVVAAFTSAVGGTTHAVVDFINAQNEQAGILSSDAVDILGLERDGTWPKAASDLFANDPNDPKDWVAKP